MRPHSLSNVTLLALLASTFALACSAPATDEGRAPSPSTAPSTTEETVVVERTASGMRHATPVTGKLVTSVENATAATVAFFARHRELGLAHPEASLVPKNVDRDELGMTHVKLQQVAHGIPVRGAEILAHYAADGSLASIDAKIVDDLDGADPTPAIASDDALAAAQKHVASESSVLASDLRAEGAPSLTFLASGRLVWAMRLSANAPHFVRAWAFVDARTGSVVESYDDIHHLSTTGIGVLGQSKKLEVEQRSTTNYVLRDTTRTPNGIDTGDLLYGNDKSKNQYVSSTNGTTWDAAGVDAHAHTAMVYDYYKAAHGRLGYDGANGQMIAYVHYQKNLDDAFNIGNGEVVYGDGAPGKSIAMSAALDIVAHEISHGVTEKSSALVYQTQSGALNEAFSDIMGAAVEHHYRPDPVKNWMHSEDAYGGKALRDFKNPRAGANVGVDLPRHMKEFVTLPNTPEGDNGGVHVNSALGYHTAYLMTMGGTNEVSKVTVPRGIGWENLAKVWYRANTRYFTSTTNFAEAAKGTLTAAKDLSLSQEDQDTIECAWIATGVLEGTCKTKAPDPKPTDSTTKSDTTKKDSDEDGDDEESTPTKKPSKRSPGQTVISSGCSTAPGDTNGSGMLATIVVVGGLAVVMRRRRRDTGV